MIRSRKSRISRLSVEAVWIVLGQALTAVASLFGIRILTELLDVNEYGKLALASTVLSLLQLTAFAGIGGAAARFYSVAVERRDLGGLVIALVAIAFRRIFVTLLVLASLILLLAPISSVFNFNLLSSSDNFEYLFIFSLIYAISSSLPGILDNLQGAARNRAVVALHQGIGTILRYAIGSIVIVTISRGATAALIGFSLASAVVLISQSYFFYTNFKSLFGGSLSLSRIKLKSALVSWAADINTYIRPFLIWGIPAWLHSASDRWSLEQFRGTADVAHFAVVYQLGYYPTAIISSLMLQFLTPIIFNVAGAGDNLSRNYRASSLAKLAALMTLIVTFFLAITTSFFDKTIFGFFAANQYAESAFLLTPTIVWSGISASVQVYSVDTLSELNPRKLLFPKISTAVIGIILNILGAYYWGAKGIVIAGVFSSSWSLVWLVITRKIRQ